MKSDNNVEVAQLSGFLQALSIMDNGFKSVSAQLCELDGMGIENSFQKQFNYMINVDGLDENKFELVLDDAVKVSDWIQWLQNEFELFIITNLPFSDFGDRFSSEGDEKEYLGWQIMEMVRSISNDFESDYIGVSNASLSDSSGKYIFIPVQEKHLVISLMERM